MSALLNIDHLNFDSTIKESSKPIMIDAYATWCGPCQHMAPMVEELAVELGDKYLFAKLNIDQARDLAIQLGIMSVPTFLFFKNGELIADEIGYMSKDQLKEKIVKHLG